MEKSLHDFAVEISGKCFKVLTIIDVLEGGLQKVTVFSTSKRRDTQKTI